MRKLKLILSSVILSVIAIPTLLNAADNIFTSKIQADFADVVVDIESEIANRGYVVDYHSLIGQMLDRTASDVGSEKSVYLFAETWQFCSSILSRKMVEVDPINVAYCPYIIFAYETRQNPGEIIVGYRAHETDDDASKSILEEIDQELESIVKEVAAY